MKENCRYKQLAYPMVAPTIAKAIAENDFYTDIPLDWCNLKRTIPYCHVCESCDFYEKKQPFNLFSSMKQLVWKT
jgi:hypothetical protein